jgi:hypothetical protein
VRGPWGSTMLNPAVITTPSVRPIPFGARVLTLVSEVHAVACDPLPSSKPCRGNRERSISGAKGYPARDPRCPLSR